MTMPNKGVIDPELKSAFDALRAGIAAAAPASQTTSNCKRRSMRLTSELATKHYGDSSFGTGSTLLQYAFRKTKAFSAF